jgi:hypothetical protein
MVGPGTHVGVKAPLLPISVTCRGQPTGQFRVHADAGNRSTLTPCWPMLRKIAHTLAGITALACAALIVPDAVTAQGACETLPAGTARPDCFIVGHVSLSSNPTSPRPRRSGRSALRNCEQPLQRLRNRNVSLAAVRAQAREPAANVAEDMACPRAGVSAIAGWTKSVHAQARSPAGTVIIRPDRSAL